MELEETAKAAFAHYDHDGSGSIDTRELQRLVADLGGVMTDQDVRAALRVLDRDRNGAIEQSEFVAWWAIQGADGGADADVANALAQLKEIGRRRFHVDIHTAAWNGAEDVVARLIEGNAELVHDKDATDYGNANTPLHYAAYRGHLSICSLLVSSGAKVNTVNRSGCTPLFYAAQQSQAEVVGFLLQHGGDVKATENQHGWSAVDVVTSPAVLDLFQSLAGKSPTAPGQPRAEAISSSEIRLQWTAPHSRLDDKLPVSGYYIKVLTESAPPKVFATNATAMEATMDELLPDTEYAFQVAAVNLNGASDFSSTSDPVKTATAKLSSPTLRVVRSAPDVVDLQWGGEPRAQAWIVLQSSAASGRSWTPVFRGDADASSTTLSGLRPETAYYFRVKAVDAEGSHAVSEPVSALTGRRISSFFRAAMAAKSMPAPERLDEEDGGKDGGDSDDTDRSHDPAAHEAGPNMAAEAKEEHEEISAKTETKLDRFRSRKAAAKSASNDESHEDDDYVYYDSSSSDE